MPNNPKYQGKQRRDHKERVRCSAENARIMGEFLKLDFKTFDAFYCIICLYLPQYKTQKGKVQMRQFWDIRNRNVARNEELAEVAQRLLTFEPLMNPTAV